MKSIRILVLLSLFAIINVSCTKSGTQPQNTSSGILPVPDNISLAFNGNVISSAMPQAIYSRTARILQITSIFDRNKSLTINVNNAAVGNFSIKNGDANAAFSLDNSPLDIYSATTGTISISSFTDTAVSGIFQFSATTTNNLPSEITDGEFLIHVITQ